MVENAGIFITVIILILHLTVRLILSISLFGNNIGLFEAVLPLFSHMCLNTVTLISASLLILNADCL